MKKNQITKILDSWEKDYYDFFFEIGKYEKREQGFNACKDYIRSLLASERQRLVKDIIEAIETVKLPSIMETKNMPITSDYLEAKKIVKKEIYEILEKLDLRTDNPQANFGIEVALKSVKEKLDKYFD